MTKTEIKRATNNILIRELANDYSLIVASNGKATKKLENEFRAVQNELLNRELLTQSDIDFLNS